MKLHQPSTAGVRAIRRIAAVVAATLFIATGVHAGAGAIADREYAEAVQTFRSGRMAEAFGRFAALANRGDPDSARVALFLHQYGPALYGKHWDAFPQDVAYWGTLVRNSGNSARANSEFAPTVLNPQKPKTRVAARNGKAPVLQSVAAAP